MCRGWLGGALDAGLAGSPFEGFGYLGELKEVGTGDLLEEGEDAGGGGAEELAATVDLVDAAMLEGVVEVGLEGDGVVAEDEGVDVGPERDRRVTDLADPVVGIRRRVIPILIMSSPNEPTLEMT
jgi:hypothetical protein